MRDAKARRRESSMLMGGAIGNPMGNPMSNTMGNPMGYAMSNANKRKSSMPAMGNMPGELFKGVEDAES